MTCEFCGEANHDQGIEGLKKVFDAILDGEQGGTWLEEKAHAAWRDLRRAETVSIPADARDLKLWLNALS
jgi:hypothetical protein